MQGKEKESRCPGSKGRRSNTGKVEIFAALDFKKRDIENRLKEKIDGVFWWKKMKIQIYQIRIKQK